MPFREPDILGVFLKQGDCVEMGGVTTRGVVDIETIEALPGESTFVSASDIALVVKTGVLPLALKGALEILDGDYAGEYTVRRIDAEPPDGAMTRVRLRKA